ncbi:MAG: SurA N-terminal domain-containing protein [Candidatus Omnitrophica bacterium]|nr:SurA N-terminal domain-containing protein [Candidatus Omnitrophota bacterium]
MLEVLRRKGVNKVVLWGITIVVILSFGVFWTANRVDNTINSVGTMYGHSVSRQDFQQAYEDARDQDIRSYGTEFFKNNSRFDLENQAWNRLILLKEAQKRHIKVSDQEVVDAIAGMPFFQTDGRFDQARYEETVESPDGFDRSPQDFEKGVRNQLMIQKLVDEVAPERTFSDANLRKIYDKENEKITLQYVLFNASDFAKKAAAGDDEIKKYYSQHAQDFTTAPTIVLNYVQTKDKALADTLSEELTPGADFAAVAKKLKLDVKTTAPFTREQPILTFAYDPDNIQKFFAMHPGEYSPVLHAPDGYQIVQVQKKNASAVPPLQDIESKVKQAVLLEKGFALAKPQADRALAALTQQLKTKDFKTAATDLGLQVKETPAFGRREFIASTGLIAEFQQEVDELNAGKRLSEVISTSQGPAIIYLKKEEKPSKAEFEADKENFREMLSAQERQQILIAFMSGLRARADVHSKIKQQ